MPNIKSAKKRLQLSQAARLRNRSERARIRTAIKKVRAAESTEEAETLFRATVKMLDRAATNRLLHPNRVARLKGQLARHVSSLA